MASISARMASMALVRLLLALQRTAQVPDLLAIDVRHARDVALGERDDVHAGEGEALSVGHPTPVTRQELNAGESTGERR